MGVCWGEGDKARDESVDIDERLLVSCCDVVVGVDRASASVRAGLGTRAGGMLLRLAGQTVDGGSHVKDRLWAAKAECRRVGERGLASQLHAC